MLKSKTPAVVVTAAASRPLWWSDRRLVVTAIAAAAVVFALGLGTHDFGRDEAVSILVADLPLERALPLLAHHEPNPAGYYVLLHFWPHSSEVLARLPSYLAAMLTVALLLLAARQLGARPLPAGALAAASPFLAYYAAEARTYSLLALMSTIALLLTWDAVAPARRRVPWPVLPVGLAAALYLHYYALFLLGAALVALWLWAPIRHEAPRVAGTTLLLFLPGAAVLLNQVELARTLTSRGWQPKVGPQELWSVPHVLFGGRENYPAGILLTVAVLALVAWGAWAFRGRRVGQFLVVLAGVQLVPILLGTVTRLVAPWYLCGALPPLLLLAALALGRLHPRAVLLPAALGLMAIASADFGVDSQKPPIRAALAALPPDGALPVVSDRKVASALAIYTHGAVAYAFSPPAVDYIGVWALPPGRPLPDAPRLSVFNHCDYPLLLHGRRLEHRTRYPANLCVDTEVPVG